MRCAAVGVALALFAAGATASDWRRVATSADRTRLRGWRAAWMTGLEQARQTEQGAVEIAADPSLYDPDRALARPMPPAGEYRCRTIKLGRKGEVGQSFIAHDWFRCRVGTGQDAVSLAKVTGSQRPVGMAYADTDLRAVFLGSLALGDEMRPMAYGRDRTRDLAGIVERIDDRRWRVAFPYPAFESVLDVIELVPADY